MNTPLAFPKLDHRLGFGIAALLSALLSLLLVALTVQGPSVSGAHLELFHKHRAIYVATAVLFMTWAVIAVPFLAAVEQLLRSRGEVLARAATMLSSVGILLLAFGYFTSLGAFVAISTAGTPPLPSEAEYQSAVWWNMSFFLSDPGLMACGLGFLLFGKLAWNSGVLPNWIAVVGIVGGVAGLLTLAVLQTPVLALAQFMCFAAWGVAVAVRIVKSSGPAARAQQPF